MKKEASYKIKKIVYFISVVLVFIIGFFALRSLENKKFIEAITEFIKDDIKVVYVSDNNNYSDYPIKLLNKYEVKNIYINSSKLTGIDKTKLEDLFNSKYLNNIIIIFEGGKIIDAIISYESEEKLVEFFQKNGIIPEHLEDTRDFFETLEAALNEDSSVIYIPYKKDINISNQSKILEKACKKYDIKYLVFNAYLLSFEQQKKLNSILEISEVEDQITIFVKNKTITGKTRNILSKSDFEKELYNLNFIKAAELSFKDININDLDKLISSTEKNIIFIGKDECKDCDDSMKVLSDIINQYDISINYLNINSDDEELVNLLYTKLESINYGEGLTYPLILITEDNKLLTYMIGTSTYEYYINEFKEFGIIK